MRMTKSNWERFDTHNKKTTIRTHHIKFGHQKVYCGSRYKPELLGEVWVRPVQIILKNVNELTEEDAKKDGFDTLTELLIELAHLNKKLTAETKVYIFELKKVKKG